MTTPAFPWGRRRHAGLGDHGGSGPRRRATSAFVNCAKGDRRLRDTTSKRRCRSTRSLEGLRTGDPEKLAASLQVNSADRLFIGDAGCRQCHSGPLFTDFEFHNIGLPAGRRRTRMIQDDIRGSGR